MKNTEFHRTMREKMKKHYHENDGRKKKVVRYYLKKLSLPRTVLQDCNSLDEQIRHLKIYNLQRKLSELWMIILQNWNGLKTIV